MNRPTSLLAGHSRTIAFIVAPFDRGFFAAGGRSAVVLAVQHVPLTDEEIAGRVVVRQCGMRLPGTICMSLG